jgi:hypothetical protein
MKQLYDWDRKEYVKKQGWATMPFEEEADDNVAARCAAMIIEKSQ